MNLRKNRRHGAEVPTHSLNDIMFFLLLFFLIIATFINPRVIKIFTAKASGIPKENPQDKKRWDVTVNAEREVFYNDQPVSMEELESMLAADKINPKMLVSLQFDPDLDIQKMVDVVSLCTKVGIKHYMKDPRAMIQPVH